MYKLKGGDDSFESMFLFEFACTVRDEFTKCKVQEAHPLGLQLAQRRSCFCTSGPKLGIVEYILGALAKSLLALFREAFSDNFLQRP